VENLWPESLLIGAETKLKDRVENYLHREVGAGRMALPEAQRQIATNWLQYARAVHLPTSDASRSRAPTHGVDPFTLLVKKSNSGVCHLPGGASYERTRQFTPYKTIEACVASGGRLADR
jgi:hypothetical protein